MTYSVKRFEELKKVRRKLQRLQFERENDGTREHKLLVKIGIKIKPCFDLYSIDKTINYMM